MPACQAGCGFSFDAASTGLNPPAATWPAQPPARPAQQAAWPVQQPAWPAQQPSQPVRSLEPSGRLPSFMSISLPNLMGQINRMMPQLTQMMMRQHNSPLMMEEHHNNAMMDSHHMMKDDYDMEEDMEDVDSFLHGNSASGSSSEESSEELSSSEEFPLMMSNVMSAPRGLDSFFGRKDEDELMDPAFGSLFANINQQMSRMMQTLPKVGSPSCPFVSPIDEF